MRQKKKNTILKHPLQMSMNKNRFFEMLLKKNQYMIYLTIFCIVILFIGFVLTHSTSYASWIKEEDRIKYLLEDGQFAVGFQEIENERYYFDAEGCLLTGKFYVEDEKAFYYADETGKILTGAFQTDEDFFITDEQGRIQTGFVEYNGNRYFYNDIAQMVVGWIFQDDKWYYADSSGVIQTGFVTIDDYRYYFQSDGTRLSVGMQDIDGVTYIFNSDGSVDENATAGYPILLDLNKKRVEKGLSELQNDSRLHACAFMRAADLKNGFLGEHLLPIEEILSNHEISCVNGYEFAYGGVAGYNADTLLEDIQKDVNFMQVLSTDTINTIGVGVYSDDDINYYSIILIQK